MKTICCQENDKIILKEHLSKAQPIVLALGPFSGEIEFQMNVPEGKGLKGLCFHLTKETVSATNPYYTESFSEIPESFLIIAQSSMGYTCYTCLSHKDLIVRLGGSSEGGVGVRAISGISRRANQQRPVVLCVQGEDLYQTINLSARLSMQLVGGKGKLTEEKPPLPSWLDTLGWESGAAYGKAVTHDKVVNAVWGLRQFGIQPGFVLIDEGWQQVVSVRKEKLRYSTMISFEADSERFPYGIKGLVEELHRAGVHHIGLWHGIMGYRGGIHPHLARGYNLPPDPYGRYFLGYDLGRTFQFFYDFYGYLKNQGVSFVKVGDQNSARDFCRPGMDVTMVFQNLQAAIQAAASIQFDTPPFNTECLRNENLFYWTTSRLASACDNLDTQDLKGSKVAIRNLLVNSLWLQHLMKPDFNAWTTNQEQSTALGMMHALSGSINVISDPPGKHDQQLIKKIVLPSGRILKSDTPLTLCQECVFQDPLKGSQVYKAFTYKGNKGIVAAFNLSEEERTLHGTVSPKDVGGLTGKQFAAFSHHNGFIGVLQKDQEMEITLKPNQSDIITFSPIQEGIAVIGCYLFLLPPGPITETTIEEESVHISSLVTAPMIMYCERQVLEIRRNGEVIPWEYDHSKNVLAFDLQSNLVELPAMYTITFE